MPQTAQARIDELTASLSEARASHAKQNTQLAKALSDARAQVKELEARVLRAGEQREHAIHDVARGHATWSEPGEVWLVVLEAVTEIAARLGFSTSLKNQ